jgi:hypothetical protein
MVTARGAARALQLDLPGPAEGASLTIVRRVIQCAMEAPRCIVCGQRASPAQLRSRGALSKTALPPRLITEFGSGALPSVT